MTYTIQLRRDTAADWTSVNPTLAQGEAGVETDTDKFKIGDGVTAWVDLPYFIDEEAIASLYATTAYVDGEIDSLETLIEAAGGSFRGAWSPDQVLWSDSFADGTIDAPWTTSGTAAAPGVTTMAGTGVGSGPAYAFSANVIGNNEINANSHLELDLSDLGLTGITKIKFWTAARNGSAGDYVDRAILKNGTPVFGPSNGTHAWTEREFTADDNDVFHFQATNDPFGASITADGALYVTGVRVYGANDPYMLNEFVTYGNKIYQSNVDNNGSTPGVDSNWTLIMDGTAAAGVVSYKGAWSSATAYATNDIVTRGGRGFVATADHTAGDYDPLGSIGSLGGVTGPDNTGNDYIQRQTDFTFQVNDTVDVTHLRFYVQNQTYPTTTIAITDAAGVILGKWVAGANLGSNLWINGLLDNVVHLVPGTNYKFYVQNSESGDNAVLHGTHDPRTLSGVISSITLPGNGKFPQMQLMATVPGTGWDALAPDYTAVLAGKASLNSPAFTGNPTAPTATAGDNDLSVANTAFVQAAIAGATPPAPQPATFVAYAATDSGAGSWNQIIPAHLASDWGVLTVKAGEGGAVTTPTGWTKLGEFGANSTTSRSGIYVKQFADASETLVACSASGPGVAFYGSTISIWRGFTSIPVLLDFTTTTADDTTTAVNVATYDKVLYLAGRWRNDFAVTAPSGVYSPGDGTGHIQAYEFAGTGLTAARNFAGATANATLGLGTKQVPPAEIQNKGDYSALTEYHTNDMVFSGGIAYVASANHLPGDYAPPGTNWTATAPPAPTGLASPRGDWKPELSYQAGDMVMKNRAAYIAQSIPTGTDDPETPSFTTAASTVVTSPITNYAQFSPRAAQPITPTTTKVVRAISVAYRAVPTTGYTVTLRVKSSITGSNISPEAYTMAKGSRLTSGIVVGDNEFVLDSPIVMVAGVQYWIELVHNNTDLNGISVAAAANATDLGMVSAPIWVNGTVDSTSRRLGLVLKAPKWLRFTPEVPGYKGVWSAIAYGKSDEVTRSGSKYRANVPTSSTDDPATPSYSAYGDVMPLSTLAASWFQFLPKAGQQFTVTAPTLVYGLNVKMAASQGAGTVTASIKSSYAGGTTHASQTSTTLVAGDNYLMFTDPILLLPGVTYWYTLEHSASDMKNVAVLAPSLVYQKGVALTASVQYGADPGSTQATQNILFGLLTKVWEPM